MVKYKVLKQFIDGKTFECREPGEVIEAVYSLDLSENMTMVAYANALTENGFIEEIANTDTRWRQKPEGEYWSIGMNPEWQSKKSPEHIQVYRGTEENSPWDDDLYEGLNYFKSEDTAKKVKLALDIFFKWLHYPSNNLDDRKPELLLNFQVAQRQARKAVLRDNKSK